VGQFENCPRKKWLGEWRLKKMVLNDVIRTLMAKDPAPGNTVGAIASAIQKKFSTLEGASER
jgi:hypothetical protein